MLSQKQKSDADGDITFLRNGSVYLRVYTSFFFTVVRNKKSHTSSIIDIFFPYGNIVFFSVGLLQIPLRSIPGVHKLAGDLEGK
jgi:hypothetical protein